MSTVPRKNWPSEIIREFRRNLEEQSSASAGVNYYWTHPPVQSKILKLPKNVRHDENIARQAWLEAVPIITRELKSLARKELGWRGAVKDFESLAARRSAIRFQSFPETEHLIGMVFSGMSTVSLSKEKVEHDGSAATWSENNVGESPLHSLLATFWVASYHKKLIQEAQQMRKGGK